jgi:hypothetical protein
MAGLGPLLRSIPDGRHEKGPPNAAYPLPSSRGSSVHSGLKCRSAPHLPAAAYWMMKRPDLVLPDGGG